MTVPFILVVCLAGVLCFGPLGLYLLWLARVTRRDRPTAVAGPWDFAGLAVGLSGFALFGGGLVLSLVQSNFRFWMRGNFEALRAVWIQERVTWSLLAFFYLVLVVGACALALLSRRRSVVVYNIAPDEFEALVGEVFEQLGRPIERRGNTWVAGQPLFALDAFEGGRTVTLRWLSPDEGLCAEVERLLRAALSAHPASDDNAVTRWLMAGASGSAAVVACCFGLFLYGISLLR
ncbi:MAG: hypothetical protein K2V38_13905 [Gemmataceae bacterium]|nr:hypothetical protein [Gemmataceae bacterium]